MLPIDMLQRYDGLESEFTCVNETVSIPGPVGRIEGITACPPEGDFRGMVAVVCHPHPLYGGSLHNKVVHYLSRTFNELGIPSLRFNFRGVGQSEGTYDAGRGESDDLLAVIDWVSERRPGIDIWLAGFSFGAYVACRVVANRPRIQRLITVAPPVNLFDFSDLAVPHCPWLVVQGRRDEIVPCQAVEQWVQAQIRAPELLCFESADHFFHGQLNLLRSRLLEHLGDNVPLSAAIPCL